MPNRKRLNSFENILIVAGEHSGDLLAGPLVRELKFAYPEWVFFGVAGESGIKQGIETIEVLENLAVIGFSEALTKYRFLKRVFQKLLIAIEARNPRLAILIDYPGFNLRLAEELKKRKIPVVFYVSPQIWAWKFKRIYRIKNTVDLMLTLFRFEEEIYKGYGVKAKHVGHPLVDRIPEKLIEERAKLGVLPPAPKKIALLPGSRKGEIRKLTPHLLKASAEIAKEFPNSLFLLPNINQGEEDYLLKAIGKIQKENPSLAIRYSFGTSLAIMDTCDILLIASGTATLEGLYFQKPMIILYKVSWFTYLLGALMIRTSQIGLANILSGEEVCVELVQSECRSPFISREAVRLLKNPNYYNKISEKLKETKSRELGGRDSTRRAFASIRDFWEGFKIDHSSF